MKKNYALYAAYQEQAYAYTDVAILFKNIFFTPCVAYCKVDALNFCVVRHDIAGHTWAAPRQEIMQYTQAGSVPLPAVFM